MSHKLSKSTYLTGVQCTKALWLNRHKKNLKDPLTIEQEAIFSQGSQVGELAKELFPGGIDATPASHFDYTEAIEKTKNALANDTSVIYEAAFQYNGVLCAVDILSKHEGAWHAYEVKSGTTVKKIHIIDAALQYYVLNNSGVKLIDSSIVVLDNTYFTANKRLEVNKLFLSLIHI